MSGSVDRFADFADLPARNALRKAVTAATRRAEPDCLPPLLDLAAFSPDEARRIASQARALVEKLRAKGQRGVVESLMREYALSSQEGVALMCLAEALLRIPDAETRDALIRDKIGGRDWRTHLGHSSSIFVNAATWGLLVTGSLSATSNDEGLSAALVRMIAKGGEPLVRRAVNLVMRLMGEQFVAGETIAAALSNARRMEARGFRFSYDMLGEAAITASDAARYFDDYERAIHAIGKVSAGRGVQGGPGISIKLSALHPRYSRAQRQRVMKEMLPRVLDLARLARHYDIGLNVDAEEADRLELSLDILEAVCFDPELAGWDGIGFVVQAYQKRCPFVIDCLVDLARRSGHRLMVRLVKGAYWDSEIKRAQQIGVDGFPVFTRKVHTDVSYLACARKLLAAPDAVYPQFATHNAQTVSAILVMAGDDYVPGQYEFQCLHGMGEPLYEEVVGPGKLDRPCRVYAPVGTHETLLAYLVRRLLENGANSSFVNRIADLSIPVGTLIQDPVEQARAIVPLGAPHPAIALPRDMFGAVRENSRGLDLAAEDVLASLAIPLAESAQKAFRAVSLLADGPAPGHRRTILNPADRRDEVGIVEDADAGLVETAVGHAIDAEPLWSAFSASDRATCLFRAADLLEQRMEALLGLIVREAGKTLANAVDEVREAVDFLRYYGVQIRDGFDNETHRPLGPVACVSPWNFPLSIFTGQVAAALAAGNPVLAKPAEETPLIASLMINILHEAGVPPGAVQFLPGAGDVGAALVADPRIQGVMFTGSTEVARLIQRELAKRLTRKGHPIPFIAETGGQNAMIADASALAEQMIADAIQSAFDSAGQRCSALRILCVQDDVADRVVGMMKAALDELNVGNPARLAVDVGPVITDEARTGILDHIEQMRARGHRITQPALGGETAAGFFVPPTIIEIDRISELTREVFGPVLHVLRFRRDDLGHVIDGINSTGYGLTFGLHTRIDEVVDQVASRIHAGNIYVNRNTIGAVVGVQPFGGHGLSGTGPKAGGPLYLRRLLSSAPSLAAAAGAGDARPAAVLWVERLADGGEAARCRDVVSRISVRQGIELPGPVGESNLYRLSPRGAVLCRASTAAGLALQITTALATGNKAVVPADAPPHPGLTGLPELLRAWINVGADEKTALFDVALFEGQPGDVLAFTHAMAERPGPIVPIHVAMADADGSLGYPAEWLCLEQSVSTNTAAAGGNASLMTLDEG